MNDSGAAIASQAACIFANTGRRHRFSSLHPSHSMRLRCWRKNPLRRLPQIRTEARGMSMPPSSHIAFSPNVSGTGAARMTSRCSSIGRAAHLRALETAALTTLSAREPIVRRLANGPRCILARRGSSLWNTVVQRENERCGWSYLQARAFHRGLRR